MAEIPEDRRTGTSLDELLWYLKRFSLSDALFLIGQINSAFKAGFDPLHMENIPTEVIAWIEEHGKGDKGRVYLSMKLSRMARFLLLSKGNDYKKEVLKLNTLPFHNAINFTGDLFDRDVEGEIKTMDDMTKTMGRMSQWQFPLQMNRMVPLGRGQLLFIDIPRDINCAYDLDTKLKKYFGLTVYEFLASGFVLWTMTNGVLKYKLNVEVESLKGVVTSRNIQNFLICSSGSQEDYRRAVRGKDWKISNKLKDIYGLDPFFHMPAIKTKRSAFLEEGAYVVPQPFYLLHRASMGIFYLLADKEKEISGIQGRNEFRDVFGNIYSEYVRRYLALARWPVKFVDFDKDFDEVISGDIKYPDFALIEGNTCVLFEVKTSLSTINARTIFDEKIAEEELKKDKGNFKKALDQLISFEMAIKDRKIKDKRFRKVKNIVKIIVGYEDIYMANAFILPIAKKIYGNVVDNLQIITISEIEMIGSALHHKIKFVKTIGNKVASLDTSWWVISGYLRQQNEGKKGKNPLLEKSFNKLMTRMTGRKEGENPTNSLVAKNGLSYIIKLWQCIWNKLVK